MSADRLDRLRGTGARVRAEHRAVEAAVKAAIDHMRRAGLALLEARDLLDEESFQQWLRDDVRLDVQTARRYEFEAELPEHER